VLVSVFFGARLPVFPAKITKLALTGSNMAIFTLNLPGKKTAVHDVTLETTPVSGVFL